MLRLLSCHLRPTIPTTTRLSKTRIKPITKVLNLYKTTIKISIASISTRNLQQTFYATWILMRVSNVVLLTPLCRISRIISDTTSIFNNIQKVIPNSSNTARKLSPVWAITIHISSDTLLILPICPCLCTNTNRSVFLRYLLWWFTELYQEMLKSFISRWNR